MGASDKTKHKIAASFEKILASKPFEEITVTDITQDCEMSRQTFYNHFLDKYDLTSWIYKQLLDTTTRRIGIDLTWEQAVRTKLTILQENQEFYEKLFRVKGADSLAANEAKIIYEDYQKNLLRLVGKQLNELESYSLKLYCNGATFMTADWVCSGAKSSVELILVADKMALPPFARKFFVV
jgi:probable dihydroxyacetone kinase regulator